MSKPTVLIIGGTGAQGAVVVRALSKSGAFATKILTRNAESPQAKELASLPDVSLIEGDCFNDADLFRAFKGVDATFVNTNGFAIGEKAEIYWGIRIFEIAITSGVKHFVYGGLDYVTKLSGYDPKFRTGHLDGKGKVGEFIRAQPTSPMKWSILNSGPYMQSLTDLFRPTIDADGTYVFSSPLGEGAGMPMIDLDDLALYALWMFQNPDKASGMTLGTSTQHVDWPYLVRTFTEVTGKPARFEELTIDEWVQRAFGALPNGVDTKIGVRGAGAVNDDTTFLTYAQNFGGWMRVYQASGGNKGLLKKDYEQLDSILPNRVKTVGEWMKKTGYTGEYKSLLKDRSEMGQS